MNEIVADEAKKRSSSILEIAKKVREGVEEGKKRDKRYYSFAGC